MQYFNHSCKVAEQLKRIIEVKYQSWGVYLKERKMKRNLSMHCFYAQGYEFQNNNVGLQFLFWIVMSLNQFCHLNLNIINLDVDITRFRNFSDSILYSNEHYFINYFVDYLHNNEKFTYNMLELQNKFYDIIYAN